MFCLPEDNSHVFMYMFMYALSLFSPSVFSCMHLSLPAHSFSALCVKAFEKLVTTGAKFLACVNILGQ